MTDEKSEKRGGKTTAGRSAAPVPGKAAETADKQEAHSTVPPAAVEDQAAAALDATASGEAAPAEQAAGDDEAALTT